MRRMWMLLLVVVLAVIAMTVPAMAAEIVQNEDGTWPTVTSCPCGMVVDGVGTHINGCTEEEVVWSPWEKTTSLNTSGNYYLTANVTTGGQVKVTAGTADAQGYLRINLNGKQITTSSNRGFWLQNYSTLVITDTAGDGRFVNTAKHDQGGAVWFNGKYAEFYLYAGTLDTSGFANQQANEYGGSAVNINGTGTFYMYGGTLIAGNAEDITVADALTFRVGVPYPNGKLVKRLAFRGPAVTSSGTFVMEGGTIYGGDVQAGYSISRGYDLNGDNDTKDTVSLVEAEVGYDLNFDGDTEDTVSAKESETCSKITFRAGQGGAIYIASGTFTMNGGTIYGGNALDGSASYINADGETVTETANGQGGAVYVASGIVNLNGGTISGGSAYEGGGVYVKGGTVNITGTTIQNGVTTYYGGNICQGGGTVNMTGGTIKDGDADDGSYYGANVAVRAGTFNMKKNETTNSTGTISGGVAKKNGGSVNIGTSGTFNMEAGLITGGKTADQGGNIWNAGTMNITGGTISGGEANNGGNIGMSSAKTSSITGAQITGGTAKTHGGNIAVNSTCNTCTLTIGTGTVITGGTAAQKGRNIFVSNNTAAGSTSWATTLNIQDGAQITQGTGTGNKDVWVQTGTYTDEDTKESVEQTVNFNIVGSDAGTVIGELYMEDTVTFTCTGTPVNYYEVVYNTLAQAIAGATASEGDYVTLLADNTEAVDVSANLNLDLNGHSVVLNADDGVNIKLMDSTAAGYTTGTGSATVTGGTVVGDFLTGDMTNYGHNYRFVTIQDDDGNYTAHRIYLAVKSTDLIPGAEPTVKHSITLRCDADLAALLNAGGTYGLAVGENSYDAIALISYEVNAYGADATDTQKINSVRFGVTNILGTDEAEQQTRGETAFTANAFMTFTDAKGNAHSITSANSSAKSLKDMVGLVNTAAGDETVTLSDALKTKLGEMYDTWNVKMTAWNWSISNLAQFATTAE